MLLYLLCYVFLRTLLPLVLLEYFCSQKLLDAMLLLMKKVSGLTITDASRSRVVVSPTDHNPEFK